ncbi:MAG: hypothetical protein IPO08_20010 [Xanthomonadales bacterium]|nr:hypothetical protein [Xanthomonadales bacterium]
MANATRTVSHAGGECPDSAIATGLLVSASTPAIEYIELGWVPSRIELINYNATNPLVYWWTKGMTSGNAYLNTGSTGVITKVTGGPTVNEGGLKTVDGVANTMTRPGFQIPAALQTDSHTWSWTAYR